MPLPAWPTLTPLAERVQPLLGGEITLRKRLAGTLWQVGFASPYELILRCEGAWVARRNQRAHQPVMLWAHSRLPTLHAALGVEVDLLLAHDVSGDGRVDVLDAWDRMQLQLKDHAGLREVCARARLEPPVVALLGEVRTFSDLQARVMALGAPGTVLEARREEGGAVTARATITVGTSRAQERRP